MRRTEILLVEDEALIAIDMKMALEENGYSVLGPFKSEARAFEAIAETTPALAVLDINLGASGDSFAIARRLRADNVPVIFLSGYSASTVPVPPDLDADRLQKPIDTDRLISAIAARLSS